jgi:superfamily I DNA/RNA helicase
MERVLREVEDLGDTKRNIDRAVSRWPKNIVWDLDPTGKTSLADQWDDFHNQGNPDFKEWLQGVEKRLQNETQDAMRYLREEFNLIQSSYPLPSRFDDYLKNPRQGRCIRFDDKIRHDCLRLLAFWEEWMITGGFIDESMMALALHFFLRDIQKLSPEYRFRCLLIDEMQDFSTMDLRLIRSLSYSEKPDSLFLAGDPVQKILVKNHNIEAANLGRGNAIQAEIKKNYRNSRQILEAASMLVQANVERAKKLEESIELLKPELALRETNRPTAVKIDGHGPDQIEAAWRLAKLTLGPTTRAKHSVCIASAAPDREGLSCEDILRKVPPGMGWHRLGKSPGHPQSVAICDLEDLKGFEFRSVILVGSDAGALPSARTPSGETWREALRLYVAMTRARDQLFFLYGPQPSEFLLEMKDSLDWINAAEILPEDNEPLRRDSLSLRTYAFVEDEAERPGFCRVSGCGHKSMIGEDYCYTHGA